MIMRATERKFITIARSMQACTSSSHAAITFQFLVAHTKIQPPKIKNLAPVHHFHLLPPIPKEAPVHQTFIARL
jgi:hypothetical protein